VIVLANEQMMIYDFGQLRWVVKNRSAESLLTVTWFAVLYYKMLL